MILKRNTIKLTFAFLCISLLYSNCTTASKKTAKKTTETIKYPSDVIPFFDHWNLILGDGSNAGIANSFEQKDFFYTQKITLWRKGQANKKFLLADLQL